MHKRRGRRSLYETERGAVHESTRSLGRMKRFSQMKPCEKPVLHMCHKGGGSFRSKHKRTNTLRRATEERHWMRRSTEWGEAQKYDYYINCSHARSQHFSSILFQGLRQLSQPNSLYTFANNWSRSLLYLLLLLLPAISAAPASLPGSSLSSYADTTCIQELSNVKDAPNDGVQGTQCQSLKAMWHKDNMKYQNLAQAVHLSNFQDKCTAYIHSRPGLLSWCCRNCTCRTATNTRPSKSMEKVSESLQRVRTRKIHALHRNEFYRMYKHPIIYIAEFVRCEKLCYFLSGFLLSLCKIFWFVQLNLSTKAYKLWLSSSASRMISRISYTQMLISRISYTRMLKQKYAKSPYIVYPNHQNSSLWRDSMYVL